MGCTVGGLMSYRQLYKVNLTKGSWDTLLENVKIFLEIVEARLELMLNHGR